MSVTWGLQVGQKCIIPGSNPVLPYVHFYIYCAYFFCVTIHMYTYVCVYIYNLHIQTKDEFAYVHCIRVLYHPIGTSRPRCWEFVSTDCVHMYIWGFWPTFWRKRLQDGTCLRTFVHSSCFATRMSLGVVNGSFGRLWHRWASFTTRTAVFYFCTEQAVSKTISWMLQRGGGCFFFSNGKLRGDEKLSIYIPHVFGCR